MCNAKTSLNVLALPFLGHGLPPWNQGKKLLEYYFVTWRRKKPSGKKANLSNNLLFPPPLRGILYSRSRFGILVVPSSTKQNPPTNIDLPDAKTYEKRDAIVNKNDQYFGQLQTTVGTFFSQKSPGKGFISPKLSMKRISKATKLFQNNRLLKPKMPLTSSSIFIPNK